MRGLWNKVVNVAGKNVLYLITVLIVLFVASLSTFGAVANSRGLILTSLTVLPESLIQVLILVFSSLVVIGGVIIFFSLKLKRINKKLLSRNNEIGKVNLELKRSSEELAAQKELIKKQYSESDKFYKILFQSADDGVSFYDSDGNLKYANPAYYSIIGYDKESYSSMNFADIIHPEDRDYRERLFNELNNKEIYESELRLKHKEGHFVNLSTKSVQVKDDSGIVLGALTISRDISKLKKINEELIKANVEAETSSRLKSSFLANISHEIRTPLNSVVGFSNLLLANDVTQEVKEEYVEQINHNSEKLLQIIGDIIDLSRLESSQIEITYEEASINEIVGEVIEESRQIIRRNEKPIILNVKNQFEDNADIVFTDKIWLKRVLTHLMDNAIKFTLDGSIEFSYYKENENLVFSIKDTGIGINKENLLRIFEEFRQEIDGHHRPFEGLGIGLTLAKEVIERMG
ncbi:MAG: PAS domain S-box protein, partial [Bacteroidales bacterium]|nr:PAS domain S-box protein [Bacteroidales bacterium]